MKLDAAGYYADALSISYLGFCGFDVFLVLIGINSSNFGTCIISGSK